MAGANPMDTKFWDFKKLEEQQASVAKQAAMANPALKQFLTGEGAKALDGGKEVDGGYYDQLLDKTLAQMKAIKDHENDATIIKVEG